MPPIKYKYTVTGSSQGGHWKGCWKLRSHWQCSNEFLCRFIEVVQPVIEKWDGDETAIDWDGFIQGLRELLKEME